MGGFYGSVQVQSQDRDQVRKAAEQVAQTKGLKCLLGPALHGWVGIYPERNGQDQTVGEEIAQQLDCDVLHMLVHDDDVMAYWLWRGGEMVDHYWSAPGYFGEDQRESQESLTGRPELFSHLLEKGTEPLRDLLLRESRFAFEYERLEKFAALLGITNAVTAYEYLKEGETDGIEGWKRFEELPADSIAQEKQAALEKRKQITALKGRLKSSGLLLAEVAKKNNTPRVCCLEQGFAVAWSNPAARDSKPILELYASPWKASKVIPLDLTPQVNDMAADTAGVHLAAALGRRVVCQAPDWDIQREVPESDWAIAVAISDDGRRLAHSSRNEVLLSDIDTGTQTKVLSREQVRALKFHPSGRHLAIVLQGGPVEIADLDIQADGLWRQLKIGTHQTVSLEPLVTQLQSLDPVELEQQQRVRLESAMQKQIESWAKEYGSAVSAKVIQRMQEQLEKDLKTIMDKLLALRSGSSITQSIASESPMSVTFTRDGQWLCCGTDKGLRVYSWVAVAAADGENMPQPQWQYDIEGHALGYIYAITEEMGGGGVLFGGLTGHLFRMDLASGKVCCLLTMPEESSILQLVMSHDGQSLGIATLPSHRESVWSIWSYQKLLAAAAVP